MLPQAGGWYVYSRRAFGEKAGFVVGCCDFTFQSVANATPAVAFAEFVGEFLPMLAGHIRLLGTVALASLAILNWIGLKTGSRAQEITSLAKALGLVALVISAFTISVKAGTASFLPSNLFAHPHSIFLGLMLALQGVVVTYDGWYAPIYFVEEDKDPAKNLPPLHDWHRALLYRNFPTGECGAFSGPPHGPSRRLADASSGCRHVAFRKLRTTSNEEHGD
jgi:basic amino acid/polyamine antiporter, APA family